MRPTRPPIRVLICDDHVIVRAGVRLILEQQQRDFELVGEAGDGIAAIALAGELLPDIVIMDLGLPGLSGLDAIPRIRQVAPEARVLALTAHEDESYFFQALKAGASGYVLKGVTPGELVGALYLVARGGVAVPRELGRLLLADYLSRGDQPPGEEGEQLTDRERDVLRLVAAGLSNKEIAEKLFLSVRTVERHRTTIMSKLGLHGKAELMRYAVRRGMIDDPESV